MERFYGDITKVKAEYLMKATPFTQEPTVNFNYRLSEEEFFNSLYSERISNAENETFDRKVNYELRYVENVFAKVNFLHISGYAGCGKTTYVRHLLWKLKGNFEHIDYEGYKRAVDPFIDRTANLINRYEIPKLCNYFEQVARRRLYRIFRFDDQLENLIAFSRVLRSNDAQMDSEYSYCATISDFESQIGNEKTFLSFLVFVNLLLLLYSRFFESEKSPTIMLIDNSDSLSDLYEEMLLLPVLKQFANDCTYFFISNLQNGTTYLGKEVKTIFHNTKFLIIFTTRFVTFKHYETIDPDWEKIYGWTSLRLPENYYDHKAILTRRIEYYSKTCSEDKENNEELILLKKLVDIAYHNYNFMRLFNGNVRVCIERLCNIISEFPLKNINELISLNDYSLENSDAIEGTNGYFLSMVLSIFKKGNIYHEKLNLSPCRKDRSLSLSRIVLTIIRESENRCSVLSLFQSLHPLGYNASDICVTVWNLCEVGRNVWRRLLVFDHIVPNSLESLLKQAELFNNGVTDIENYSQLVICTAGLAYMEFVVPHFEFMLSRHEMGADTFSTPRYQALFSSSSEQNISNNPEKVVYRFEKKIDTVFADVKDCCHNSLAFADRAMKAFNLNRSEYIRSTTYNYHTVGWDGEIGPKQSYESRLIFRHIGYIEKYRRYLLKKYEGRESVILADINRRLVERIIRYIKLYQDARRCFQTDIQNRAAEQLLDYALIIKNSGYKDIDTIIELPF